MKKFIFLIATAYMALMPYNAMAAAYAESLNGQLVSSGVVEALQNKQKVRVLIKLRTASDSPSRSRTSTSKDQGHFISKSKIKELQDSLLSSFTDQELQNDIAIKRKMKNIPWLSGEITNAALSKLKANSNVAAIIEDRQVHASLAESRKLINADLVNTNLGYTGNGVNVAVIDTGIDTHTGLVDNIAHEECFMLNNGCPSTGASRASGPGSAADDSGHGTHVAGIITSASSPNIGISPGAGIVAIKVLDSRGNGWNSDIIAGVDWSTTNKDTYDIRVINMSLGGVVYAGGACDSSEMAFADAALAAKNAGITIFAASGNDGFSVAISSPACLSSVVSVGAVYDANVGSKAWGVCTDSSTAADKIICFSNAAEILDVLAPGSLIRSTGLGNTDLIKSGTSMSAPHAAGLAALMLEKNSSLSPDEITNTMKSTGSLVDDVRNGMSFPRIDALAAVNAVPNPDLSVELILSQSVLVTGDSLTVDVKVVNDSTANDTDLKIWLKGPSGTVQSVVRISDFTVPSNNDTLETVLSHTFTALDPKGTYSVGAVFLNNITGKEISLDEKSFSFSY